MHEKAAKVHISRNLIPVYDINVTHEKMRLLIYIEVRIKTKLLADRIVNLRRQHVFSYIGHLKK